MIIYSTPENSKQLTRWVEEKKIAPLAKGVYTNITDPLKLKIEIESKLLEIMEHLGIEGILSYQSGLDYYRNNWGLDIWVAGKREREVSVGPYHIHVLRGNEKETNEYATEKLGSSNLRVPSLYRVLLQNFSQRKKDLLRTNKNLALEHFIQTLNSNSGNYKWEIFEPNLTLTAQQLNYEKEVAEILLATQKYKADNDAQNLDLSRLALFQILLEKIKNKAGSFNTLKNYSIDNVKMNENCAFFESYFSNYIEGTEFEVDEAYSIIYDKNYKYTRHADGNDITKTYGLILDNISNPIEIKTSQQYIEQIQKWHTTMLSHRADSIMVGEFKNLKNKAGSTKFVEPKYVRAMLVKSFDMAQELKDPFARALFLKISFTEIHPFDDGNGRISRIILNNELSLAQKQRIMIPNVFRDDYITALKAFSQSKNVAPIMVALNKAALISNDIPYQLPFGALCDFLVDKSAFTDPAKGMWGVRPELENEKSESLPLGQLDLFPVSTRKNRSAL